jgi:hypothetical protein
VTLLITCANAMHDRPSAAELVEAVRLHLTHSVLPALGEPRLRFQTLVAANVLAIVGRELAAGLGAAESEWARLSALLGTSGEQPRDTAALLAKLSDMNAQLCTAIEAGAFDDPASWTSLLRHCRQTAEEKLAVANPAYLERTRQLDRAEAGKQEKTHVSQ